VAFIDWNEKNTGRADIGNKGYHATVLFLELVSTVIGSITFHQTTNPHEMNICCPEVAHDSGLQEKQFGNTTLRSAYSIPKVAELTIP
jgi:hypothetical protein